MALELFKADELKILNKSYFCHYGRILPKKLEGHTYLNFSLFFNYLDSVVAYN